MARVPYQPVPEEQPRNASVSIPTPPEAFGATIAAATQQAGQEVKSSGDQLFARAEEMQRLKIEADVNQKVSDYLVSSGGLDNEFRQLTGAQAQEKLEAHKNLLRQSRESYKSQIDSPYGQKMFDRETMRRFGYDVVNASNYAATELKRYNKDMSTLKDATLVDRLTTDARNDLAIDREMGSMVGSTSLESDEEHDTAELKDFKIKAKVGAAITKIAVARSKDDPDGAEALVNRYYKKNLMTAVQYEDAITKVRERGDQSRAIMEGARISGPDQNLLDSRKAGIGVRTETLTPELRDRASDAISAAEEATGAKATIESAKRTTAEQAQLYQRYRTGRGGLAAPPGQSMHETGEALDFQSGPVLDKLREWYKSGELEKKYGLTMLPDRANDPGHMQLAEGRKAYEKPAVPQAASEEQRLIDKHRAAEDAADRLMDLQTGKPVKDVDPVRYQRYLDSLIQNVDKRASVQQRVLNDQIKGLKADVGQVMVQQLPSGRGPTDLNEGDSLDRSFSDKVAQVTKLDPTYKARLDNWFRANAKQDIPPTPEREANYIKYLGLSDEDRQRVDPNAMFNQSLITRGDANKIMENQGNIRRSAEQNARVEPVLTRHHELLNDARAFQSRSDPVANERYKWLKGAAILRMQEHIDQTKTRMTPKEEDEMMGSLVAQVSTGKYDTFFGIPYGYFTGNMQEAPSFEQESLRFPVQINTKTEYNGLRSGQVYVKDGTKRVKP